MLGGQIDFALPGIAARAGERPSKAAALYPMGRHLQLIEIRLAVQLRSLQGTGDAAVNFEAAAGVDSGELQPGIDILRVETIGDSTLGVLCHGSDGSIGVKGRAVRREADFL